MRDERSRWWFHPALLLTVICLAAAQLLFWRHGLYLDDYALRTRVIDPVTGMHTPMWSRYIETFPARLFMHHLTFALVGAVPRFEFAVRALIALAVGINGCLLGLLVHRCLGSRTAALVASWTFMVPVFAAEVVYWTTAATEYLMAVMWALILALVVCDAATGRRTRMQAIFLCAVTMAMGLMFAETQIAIAVIAPMAAVIAAVRQGHSVRPAASRSLWAMSAAVPLLVGFSIIVATSPFAALRGGVEVSATALLWQVRSFTSRAYWLTVSPEWGWPVLRQMAQDGWDGLSGMWAGRLAIGGAAACAVCIVALWRSRTSDRAAPYACGIAAVAVGLFWVVLSMFVPAALVGGQVLESRLLYFPTAGAAFAVAGLTWLLEKRTRGAGVLGRAPLVLGVLGLLAGSTAMTGYSRLYAERFAEDSAQLAAVTDAVPVALLPRNAVVLPYRLDRATAAPASRALSGVFESWWSATEALKAAYRRSDITAVTTNRWDTWRFASSDATAVTLRVQGAPVSLDRLVVVAEQHGSVLPVRALMIASCGGKSARVVLPAVQAWAARGRPVIDALTVPGERSATCPPAGETR
jgi:hypothetical protein